MRTLRPYNAGREQAVYFFFIASATLPTSFGPGLSVMSPCFFHWAGTPSDG